MPRAVEAPQLLDVDVNQLSWTRPFVAILRLRRLKSGELAEARASDDSLHARLRKLEHLGYLSLRELQSPQRYDRLSPSRIQSRRANERPRRTVHQAGSALCGLASCPLAYRLAVDAELLRDGRFSEAARASRCN